MWRLEYIKKWCNRQIIYNKVKLDRLPDFIIKYQQYAYKKKFVHLSSWTRCDVILAPDAANGWPIAIAPPLTLSFSMSSFNSFWQASVWAPNASLIFGYNKHITFLTNEKTSKYEFWLPQPNQYHLGFFLKGSTILKLKVLDQCPLCLGQHLLPSNLLNVPKELKNVSLMLLH